MTWQPHGPTWPPEKVERLTHLWVNTQITAQAIADELGFASRSVITGKVFRMGLVRTNPRAPHHKLNAFRRTYDEWPAETLETAISMFKDGKRQFEIAEAIGKTYNAVNKKLLKLGMRRLRLVPRPKRSHHGKVTGTTPKPPRISPEAAWKPLPQTTPIEFLDLNSFTCRWPIGEQLPYQYCGQGKPFKQSYCVCHAVMAEAKTG